MCSTALYYSLQVPAHSPVPGRNLLPLTVGLRVHVTLVWLQPATSQTGTAPRGTATRRRTDASVRLSFNTVRTLYSCLSPSVCTNRLHAAPCFLCGAHYCQVTGNYTWSLRISFDILNSAQRVFLFFRLVIECVATDRGRVSSI